MPDRSLQATHSPPTAWERLLAHPGTVVTLVVASAVGVGLFIDGILPEGWLVGVTLGRLDDIVKLYAGIVLFMGAKTTLSAMFLRPSTARFDMSWAMERAGWVMIMATSLALLFAVFEIGGTSFATYMLFVQWFFTGGLRIVALQYIEAEHRRVQARIRKASEEIL